jgi:hypothetical protein
MPGAQKFYALALVHSNPADLPTADRMIGTSYHYLGDQANAWRHIERMLSPDVDARRRSPFFRFWFDQEVVGRVVLARILWLRGSADQAWRTLVRAVGDAEALTTRPPCVTPCATAAAWSGYACGLAVPTVWLYLRFTLSYRDAG